MQHDRFEPVLKKIGTNIRRIRKDADLSMEEVSLQTGIDLRQLGRIERGEGNVTIVSLLRIAEVIKAELNQLLT